MDTETCLAMAEYVWVSFYFFIIKNGMWLVLRITSLPITTNSSKYFIFIKINYLQYKHCHTPVFSILPLFLHYFSLHGVKSISNRWLVPSLFRCWVPQNLKLSPVSIYLLQSITTMCEPMCLNSPPPVLFLCAWHSDKASYIQASDTLKRE